jgi:hypothetical protein
MVSSEDPGGVATAILQKRPWNFTSVRRKDDELFFAIYKDRYT